MSEQTFEDRVAALQEHIVTPKLTAGEFLARAEREVAAGNFTLASIDLSLARLAQAIDRHLDEEA